MRYDPVVVFRLLVAGLLSAIVAVLTVAAYR